MVRRINKPLLTFFSVSCPLVVSLRGSGATRLLVNEEDAAKINILKRCFQSQLGRLTLHIAHPVNRGSSK